MPRKKALKTRIREVFQPNNLKKEVKKLKPLAFYAIVMGLVVNYSLWGTFGIKFAWYTFPAWGILLYLIKSEAIYIIRWMFHKVPGVEE